MSDRIEKEDPDTSTLLQELEKDSIRVVRGDWNAHLGTELRGGEENLLNILGTFLLIMSHVNA